MELQTPASDAATIATRFVVESIATTRIESESWTAQPVIPSVNGSHTATTDWTEDFGAACARLAACVMIATPIGPVSTTHSNRT